MKERKKVDRAGGGSAETSHIAADPAPARRRRLTAVGKQEAVLRVLRCEDVGVWRDAFLEAGASGLKHRPRDAGDDEIDRLRGKVGEITMDNELLYGKIAKMEAGRPFGRRRSRRWVPSSRSPRARPAVYHGCAGSGV